LVVATGGGPAPEYQGTDPAVLATTEVIPFNDVAALETVLAPHDVALLITEPAMTNIGYIEPLGGYHEALRALTRDTGTLLLIDETQTLMCAYGGLTNAYGLEPDMFVVGKSIGGGIVPFSAYGMAESIASRVEAPHAAFEVSGEPVDEIALGGTMWSYAVGAAAARAALEHVLTQEAYERTVELGGRLSAGIAAAIADAGLPWTVQRLGTRAGYTPAPVFRKMPSRLARPTSPASRTPNVSSWQTEASGTSVGGAGRRCLFPTRRRTSMRTSTSSAHG
jgi:glutamate-1-semialdehyde 2,1-aminomutase